MSNTQKARDYCKQYGATLPKAWRGYRLIWHPWHQPADRLLWPMTYVEYCDRVVETAEHKPHNERKERLHLMKPCVSIKVIAAWNEDYAAWKKAIKAWNKAIEVRDKASEAWNKAIEARREKNHDGIMAAHAKECPDCKWDGEKLPQFN